MKGIMQDICDDLASQGVLKIPQQHNILVQSVCPSFLKRKRRAANIPKHQLTKDHCRLLINFSPVNQLFKNIPSPMSTPEDLDIQMGRWKEITVMDLYSACYQNHMHPDSQPYLGIMTPFSEL